MPLIDLRADGRTDQWAVLTVMMHQAAGYKVHIQALGEDGADGFELETERRDGTYVQVKGISMERACEALAEALK